MPIEGCSEGNVVDSHVLDTFETEASGADFLGFKNIAFNFAREYRLKFTCMKSLRNFFNIVVLVQDDKKIIMHN